MSNTSNTALRDRPPPHLAELLADLDLATAEQLRRVTGEARRLARDLPMFDSVWLDALVRARRLTPFQAAEIAAGRGKTLAVGPYLCARLLGSPANAKLYLARHRATKHQVHLVVAHMASPEQASDAKQFLEAAASTSQLSPAAASALMLPIECGAERNQLWAAYPKIHGMPAREWLSHEGRLPPSAVLEIARQMAAVLAESETVEGLHRPQSPHGDITPSSLWLTGAGEVRLLRGHFRQAIGNAGTILAGAVPWEELDYVSPERIVNDEKSGQTSVFPSNVAGDLYSCGSLWWHLLAGRPPLAGGNHAAKLALARVPKFTDVRQLAADVPGVLLGAISACTEPDAGRRPRSFAELAERLGPPAPSGCRRLAAVLARSRGRRLQPAAAVRLGQVVHRAAPKIGAALACCLLLAAATWPLWRPNGSPTAKPNRLATPTARQDSKQQRRRMAEVLNAARVAYHRRQIPSETSEKPRVRQANYLEDQGLSATRAAPADVIELPKDTETAASALRLKPGSIVRGANGGRAKIIVPRQGMRMAADGAQFENIDFVGRNHPDAVLLAERGALVEIVARNATFTDCSFQVEGEEVQEDQLAVAVRLTGPDSRASILAPAVQVRLSRCVLKNVAAGIECTATGPIAVRLENTLHLGSGPCVHFPRPRPIDAPTEIQFDHTTVREAEAVVRFVSAELGCDWGPITLGSVASVLCPSKQGSLLEFIGPQSPQAWIRKIQWEGQGTLFAPRRPVAIWKHDEETAELAADAVKIDGLVTTEIEFSGSNHGDPKDSVLRQWVAPLQSDQPPGIAGNLPAAVVR